LKGSSHVSTSHGCHHVVTSQESLFAFLILAFIYKNSKKNQSVFGTKFNSWNIKKKTENQAVFYLSIGFPLVFIQNSFLNKKW
jgi:hypothetical protein